MTSALDAAKASMRMAVDRVTTGDTITDWCPSGDADLDERRLDLICELSRQLSPTESFNLAAGLPHDFRPPDPPRPDPNAPLVHPEIALREGAK